MTEGGAAWTRLGDGILVRQSQAFWMNSVVLLDPEHTVVVDPGVLPSELDDLARVVGEAAPEALTLFFTHGHWDHVLGRPWWPEAHTLAHDRLTPEVKRDRLSIAREATALAAEYGEGWPHPFAPFHTDIAVSGLRFMPLGPWRLVFRDAPGHSDSQLSCHIPDRGVLIAADMLSDIEPPILDGPCAAYRKTLESLMELAEHGAIETVVPGHGSVAQGEAACIERLLKDSLYLAELEVGVNLAIERGEPLEAARETLAAMDYTGRRSDVYPTERFHLENIEFAYRGVTAPHH